MLSGDDWPRVCATVSENVSVWDLDYQMQSASYLCDASVSWRLTFACARLIFACAMLTFASGKLTDDVHSFSIDSMIDSAIAKRSRREEGWFLPVQLLVWPRSGLVPRSIGSPEFAEVGCHLTQRLSLIHI